MTDQWSFVAAAYVLTALGTGSLLASSWLAMRRAEAKLADLVQGDD
jgi:hypothetical protein